MFIFLFLLTLPSFLQSEEFHDLILGDDYTTWRTNGNLEPTFFRCVLNSSDPPSAIRVSVTSEKVSLQNPITVNIIRGKTVHNIALPRIQSQQGTKYTYWIASDTLCDDDNSIVQIRQPVFLSIASSVPSDFRLLVKPASNFYLKEQPFQVNASPSEPRYYMYTFLEGVEKVDIRAHSDSNVCARLIVRRKNCPLFDGSGLLELSDDYFYQTFTKFAGFSLRIEDIGPQFHLAITVLPDDTTCGTFQTNSSLAGNPGRVKKTRITVAPVSEQTFLSMLPLLVYGLSIAVVLFLTFLKYKWLDRYENNEPENSEETNIVYDKSWLFDKPYMTVSHKEYEKQRLVKDSKYFNFLFFQIFGSILPALTTLFQNRQRSTNKMNLDTCFLNYLCSLDMLHFNSFNSVASVSSLAIIGILNLIVVFRKKIFCYQVPRLPTTHGIQQREAPKVVCLLSLVAMGLLGIITNNCPNKSTSHLYVYTSLWIFYSAKMWLYSKRHGVRKWQQFYIIAVSSVFGCLTLADNMFELSQLALKIAFSIISLFVSGYFCYQYYYERPSGLQNHQWVCSPFQKQDTVLGAENSVFRPLRSKILFITAAMSFSLICSLKTLLDSDLRVTSAIFNMGRIQLGIYLFYYIFQKIKFEGNTFTTSYEIIGFFLISYFVIFEVFVHEKLANQLKPYDAMLTPARSRELNHDCVLPGIDWNDVLHYNCSINWLVFIILMDFIDSNLKKVPKNNIFVF